MTELEFVSVILLILALSLSICIYLLLHGMSKVLKKLQADIERMKGRTSAFTFSRVMN